MKKPFLSTARGFCTEYFIIGDPRVSGGAHVFTKDTQTGKVSSHKQAGVFDDYYLAKAIPDWVQIELLKVLSRKR